MIKYKNNNIGRKIILSKNFLTHLRQFNDGVRVSFQLTSIFGHFVCKHVNIGFDIIYIDFKSLSSNIAAPLLYFICYPIKIRNKNYLNSK